MRDSKLKKLWSGILNVGHLKEINLFNSKDLIEMPDISRATNLERVCLCLCQNLRELHPSVLSLPKLEELNLSSCTKIESLKSDILSKSLRSLDLTYCSSLVEFSVISEEMTSLQLTGTAIRELSSSIWRNRKLSSLTLNRCYKLNIVGRKLSNDPRLRYLTFLNLRMCTQMDTLNLSLLLDGIHSLEKLYLKGCCNLEALPHNIHKHSELNYLELDDCTKLVLSCPTVKLPPYLSCLSAFNCTLMDTDNTQRLLFENNLLQIKNEMLQDRFTRKFEYFSYLFIPGDHENVLGMFDFQKPEGASITIPPIPKSNLRAFMFCILLSHGLYLVKEMELECVIYEHGKKVGRALIDLYNRHMILNSDHVLLCLFEYDIQESEGDHCNLSFEFEQCNYEDDWSTQGIKGCGVHPIYALEPVLKLDDKSSSRMEIVELESTVQVCDVDELQARVIGVDVEDDQQQLSYYTKEEDKEFNAKSSCDCSIGLLLKYLIERSTDTIMQVRNVLCSISSRVK